MTAVATDNMLLAAPDVEIEAGAERSGGKPRISIVAYTGGVMRVPGWGDVALDLAGLDASGQIPLLADHDARVSGVVGHGEARVADGRLVVAGVMSGAGEAARQIVEMTAGRLAFQASVGVEPVEHERIKPRDKVQVNGRSLSSPRGFALVKQGRLREVSITPLGADAGMSVAIAASRHAKERLNMDANVQNLDEQAIRADERQRIAEIENLHRKPDGGWGRMQAKVDELKASATAAHRRQDHVAALDLGELFHQCPRGIAQPRAPHPRSQDNESRRGARPSKQADE